MTALEKKDIQLECEYREWREGPLWYCVKTTFGSDGKTTSEIIKDEKTKVPLTIQSFDKPLDGVREANGTTTYYSYYRGYKEAAQHLAIGK